MKLTSILAGSSPTNVFQRLRRGEQLSEAEIAELETKSEPPHDPFMSHGCDLLSDKDKQELGIGEDIQKASFMDDRDHTEMKPDPFDEQAGVDIAPKKPEPRKPDNVPDEVVPDSVRALHAKLEDGTLDESVITRPFPRGQAASQPRRSKPKIEISEGLVAVPLQKRPEAKINATPIDAVLASMGLPME